MRRFYTPVGAFPHQPACAKTLILQSDCAYVIISTETSNDFLLNFIPSQMLTLLAFPTPHYNQMQCHSGFVLHTITGFHRPELNHYYGIICHPAMHQMILGQSLVSSYQQY